MRTDREVLETILSRDPDGGEVQPTARAYADFRNWVIATYGEQAWQDYQNPNWGNFGMDVV